MRKNVVIDSDIYKFAHFKSINPKLTGIYSYGEPRIGAKYRELCFFGMGIIIQDHFMQRVTETMIKEGEQRLAKRVGNYNMFGTEIWRKVENLGYLPIRIKALPEGTIADTANVFFTVEATKDWFAPMAQFLEGTLMHVWYPTEIASRSYHIKKGIKPIFQKTCDNLMTLDVALNDFGYRGATCHEAAARGGAGHLVSFKGSDNEPAMTILEDYYNCSERLLSVWATEHSDAMSFDNELDYVKHQLQTAHPDQIVSIVTDLKDQDNFFMHIACHPEIVEMVKQRNGRVVWRPDTGNPLTNVCKYSDILAATYGFTMNSKGYKVLSNNVGIIQGDGMNENSIVELYTEYIKTGWAADNVVTGSGGGLLQADATRDSNRWAIKPSYMEIDGVGVNVSKTPKSDPTKTSKSGKLKNHYNSTVQSSTVTNEIFEGYIDNMEVVYENGAYKRENFDNIVSRANKF